MARIVLVEDQPKKLADICRHLDSHGHEVMAASDGNIGLAVVDDTNPDLVLTDVRALYERELVAAFGQDGAAHADTELILLAPPAAISRVVEDLANGADDYVLEPIDYDLLDAKINAFVRKRDSMLLMFKLRRLASSLADGATAGMGFILLGTVLGVVSLLVVYGLKSSAGIDLFPDTHLSDIIFR